MITPEQWAQYEEHGYLKLGKVLDDADLSALQRRIDEIMLGRAPSNYDGMLMQLDSETGSYEDAGVQSRGHKGASLGYRKIQDLEHDDLFLAFMQRPVFREICQRVYGEGVPIAAFRAMFMNKPARKGTFLPWHQDRWTHLDRDPLVTTWTALDRASIANGCVQIIPASHKLGVVNPSHDSGFLTKAQAAELCRPARIVYLELEAGEVALLHNWVIHGSDVNRTDTPRRAFSVCYMDARTRGRNGESYSTIFGEGALTPRQI